MKNKERWTISDIPSQKGRLILVTGTGGLGYITALILVRAGAEVILAGRNRSKGRRQSKKFSQMLFRQTYILNSLILEILPP